MSFKNTLITVLILILLTIALSMMAANTLPDRIASHWDANGVVNGYQSKAAFIWTMPGIMVLTALLMLFLPKIDPKKASFMDMRDKYHLFIVAVMIFMFALQIYIILQNMGFKFNIILWMIPLFASLMVATGFLLERATMNWFVGIRTPWTLSSPVVWKKTHRLGGLLFKICGLITLLGLFFEPVAFLFIMIPMLGVSFFIVVYSYIIYQQEQKRL